MNVLARQSAVNRPRQVVHWLMAAIAAFWAAQAVAGENKSAGNAALFDRLDANHDGTLADGEITSDSRTLFDRLLRRGDANQDKVLSREEFLAALVPTRPEKPIEAAEPVGVPDANAVRYLLVKMDSNGNARIEKDEVPDDLSYAYEVLAERVDRNNNDSLERQELDRAGQVLSPIAARYVARTRIDVDAELAKLERKDGDSIMRFEQQPVPLMELRDAKQARRTFTQLDDNADGQLDPKEVPDPIREPIGRLVRLGDSNDDGKLSESEFTTATERLSKFFRGRPGQPFRDMKSQTKSKVAADKPNKVKGKDK